MNKVDILELPNEDYKKIIYNLGKKIKLARIKKEVSLTALCQICDISESYLSRVENGKISSPSLKVYLKICYSLNMNPSIFFSDLYTMPPFNDKDYKFIE